MLSDPLEQMWQAKQGWFAQDILITYSVSLLFNIQPFVCLFYWLERSSFNCLNSLLCSCIVLHYIIVHLLNAFYDLFVNHLSCLSCFDILKKSLHSQCPYRIVCFTARVLHVEVSLCSCLLVRLMHPLAPPSYS